MTSGQVDPMNLVQRSSVDTAKLTKEFCLLREAVKNIMETKRFKGNKFRVLIPKAFKETKPSPLLKSKPIASPNRLLRTLARQGPQGRQTSFSHVRGEGR